MTSDCKGPTVLEFLVYWLVSAIDLYEVEGLYKTPLVRSEPRFLPYEIPACVYDASGPGKDPLAAYYLSLLVP